MRIGYKAGAYRHGTLLIAAVALAIVTGCDRNTLPTGTASPPHVYAQILTPAAVDPTMGAYSQLARHIVIALQDSAVRMQLYQAINARGPGGAVIDLSTCSMGLSSRILAAGEQRGAGSARLVCDRAKSGVGAILYMNAESAAAWRPNSIAIVTAISDPSAPLPS